MRCPQWHPRPTVSSPRHQKCCPLEYRLPGPLARIIHERLQLSAAELFHGHRPGCSEARQTVVNCYLTLLPISVLRCWRGSTNEPSCMRAVPLPDEQGWANRTRRDIPSKDACLGYPGAGRGDGHRKVRLHTHTTRHAGDVRAEQRYERGP